MDFDNKDVLEMIFFYKKALEMISTVKCIGNDFYYKNVWQIIFTIKCIENDLITIMHWK